MKILSVMIGGAAGALLRYLINISPIASTSSKFPWPTFVINLTGSFLIGLLVTAFAAKFEADENLRLLLIVGFLGAFTTFSAFEMELYTLMAGREYLVAFAYFFLSVFLGFVGVAAGVELGRRF